MISLQALNWMCMRCFIRREHVVMLSWQSGTIHSSSNDKAACKCSYCTLDLYVCAVYKCRTDAVSVCDFSIRTSFRLTACQWSSACMWCRQSGLDRCGWGRVKLSVVLALVQWGGSFSVYQSQLWDEPYPGAIVSLPITDQHQRHKQMSSPGSLLSRLATHPAFFYAFAYS